MNAEDTVNQPKHYISKSGLEVFDVVEAFTENLTGIEAFCTGNIIKYGCRWSKKNGIEDIKKLIVYANRLVNHLELKNIEKEGLK